MPVDTQHPLYELHVRQSTRTRDAVDGSDSVKAKGTTYLPDPDPADPERYKAYKKRAVWMGVTGRTHAGMLGGIFRKAPDTDLPQPIEYMQDDADGAGIGLEQFAKRCCSHVIQAGRHGVLVEYPPAPSGLTEEQASQYRAKLTHYAAESIINWEGNPATMIVLKESYLEEVDEFERREKTQYRVLKMREGVYTQQVWRDGIPGDIIVPRMANARPWPFIPFQFLGAMNNDPMPDKPLLLDIADLNFAHYRNSADHEESSYIVGQPMPHVDIGEMDESQWNSLNPSGMVWGSRQGVQTRGGSLNLVQAAPNTMPGEGMVRKEAQMLAIGARLIEQRGGNEREEAVKSRVAAENANLASVATNVGAGLRQCLRWALSFMSRGEASSDIVFELNQEFYERGADPQMVMARIAELDRGLIAKQDYRDWRRKTGGIEPDRTDEEIDADVQAGGTDLGVM
ncbi:MAG: DUF4055 domain-containing protein [Phycisphaerae bacterium]